MQNPAEAEKEVSGELKAIEYRTGADLIDRPFAHMSSV
jgi:hypothetical protein